MLSESQLVANLSLLIKSLGAPKIAMDLGISCSSTVTRWAKQKHIPFKHHREVDTYVTKAIKTKKGTKK